MEQVRQRTEQAGQARTYERMRPDGRVIEIRHNPVPSGGFVLNYADITERKRSEAEIRAARDAAEEASRTASLGREAGMSNWVKLEGIGDEQTLFPDNTGLLEATRVLAK